MQNMVQIKSNDHMLRGTLHIPEGASEINKVPIVTIFHGFTSHRLGPHFIFVKLSRILESQGIASIRFDFAGSGESDGEFIDMTMETEIQDGHNILDYVYDLEFIDNKRVGLLGLSMGGAVASIVAGQKKNYINTLCLWAPAGNIDELVLSENNISNNLKKFNEIGYHDFGGYLIGNKFIEDLSNIKIYEKSALYDKKSLIIHGNKDEMVPIRASEKYIEIYKENSTLKVIKGANHTFDKKEWEEEVLKHTVEYFVEELNA